MVFFYALCKCFASFLAKQFANKLKHDIIHARRVLGFTLLWVAWRLALLGNLRRGFSVHWRRIEAVLVQFLSKHKLISHMVYKNAMLDS